MQYIVQVHGGTRNKVHTGIGKHKKILSEMSSWNGDLKFCLLTEGKYFYQFCLSGWFWSSSLFAPAAEIEIQHQIDIDCKQTLTAFRDTEWSLWKQISPLTNTRKTMTPLSLEADQNYPPQVRTPIIMKFVFELYWETDKL